MNKISELMCPVEHRLCYHANCDECPVMYEENKEQICEYCGGELAHIMLDDETYAKCVECKRINY